MNKLKKYFSIFLCITLLMTGMGINGALFRVLAAEDTLLYTATVNVDDELNVREGPGTTYKRIGVLKPNVSVNIYSEKTNGWYKIGYGTGYGYVSGDYLKNIKPILQYDYDADFETNLEKQGFPESYKVELRKLHANHPNWIFTADQLSMTWAEAVKNESIVGKSLVQDGTSLIPDSYKSMMKDAYNWNTGKYVSYDTGGWVTAEPDVVEYYMEPRNFLNENYIFMFLDQTYNPNLQNIEGLRQILKGTFMEGEFPEDTFETWADVIMDAAKQSGVSPYVLAASIIIEQGSNGKGASISGTEKDYEGYYNFFNISAYADDGLTAVAHGLLYAKGGANGTNTSYNRPWNTRAKSILGGALYYAKGYVNRGQDTLYYKKFNVITPTYYINQYMTNVQGAYHETGKLKSAYSGVNSDAPLTFAIPVYKNMSETNKTALPTSKGANNYYLLSLKVNGKSVANFDKYVNSYEMIVESSVSEITVAATAQSTAKISGTGNVALKEGKNTVTVTVTAASGKTAKYTISVFREEGSGDSGGGEPTIPDPTVSGKYTISTYVSGVATETKVADFIKNFGVKDGTAKVFNSTGKEKTSGVVATGDSVAIYDTAGKQRLKYSIVIFGDVNGDGKIKLVDLARIQKHLLGVINLKDEQGLAADLNKDNKIKLVDLAKLQKHLLGIDQIKQ